MAYMRRGRTLLFAFSCCLFLTACTSVLIAGASGGIAYTFTNVAYKTIPAPIDQVEFANRLALLKLGIRYIKSTETENEVRITAETAELKIYIDLERITAKTTKISVDARKSVFTKDKSTAAAVITETEAMLANE